jgi:hypothetical protein
MARTRLPITLYVDSIEFEPAIDLEPVKTVYDLELSEQDMIVLYNGLGKRLGAKYPVAVRIRITGRLVS